MFETLNAPGRPKGDSGIAEVETEKGTALRLTAMPDAAKDQDGVTVELSLKAGTTYYYMELDGHAYDLSETTDEYTASFVVTK